MKRDYVDILSRLQPSKCKLCLSFLQVLLGFAASCSHGSNVFLHITQASGRLNGCFYCCVFVHIFDLLVLVGTLS